MRLALQAIFIVMLFVTVAIVTGGLSTLAVALLQMAAR
jgi:hypothetical protein